METLRFADAQTVLHYPLEIPTAARWRAVDGGFEANVDLPDLPSGWIIAPSLSMLDDDEASYCFTLRIGESNYPLARIPAASGDLDKDPSDARVRRMIDCFHLLDDAVDPRFTVTVNARQAPERYLLTVSARPVEMDPSSIAQPTAVQAPVPPRRSQMLENPRIANRVCSPVSTGMVLASHRPSVDYQQVIDACFDPTTKMYGMWPLAVRAASQHACIGAVELLRDWAPVVACLERQLPVVASIRYGPGELPGAPQRSTGGHLVVVHGLTEPSGDGPMEVLVNDPAAPDHGSVLRRYPLEAFARAWFRYRGAAYILTP